MKRKSASPLATIWISTDACSPWRCSSYLHAAAATPPVDGITAIYNFGDSISDTGNLIREQAAGLLEHIGKPPYGMDINGPTGRCSNGYLMIDFLGRQTTMILETISRSRWHCFPAVFSRTTMHKK
jgi:phospholipase/lecithinase/hemolysin